MFAEFAIIGGGQAGIPLARSISRAGHSTVLIEGKHLGGSCVNYGCTPTKAVIASARLAYQVGLSEKEALEKYSEIRVGRFSFLDNGKANETRDIDGFIKLIAHPTKDELLGATVLGPHGSEVVQLYVTLLNAKAPFSVIRDAIYIHPTLAEAAQSAVYELSSAKKTDKRAA